MKKFGLFSIATITIFAQVACQKSSDEAKESPAASPVRVRVQVLSESPTPEVYVAPGTIRAAVSAALSSRIPAYVQSVVVHEGDRVRAGQTLVTLNGADLDARVLAAQSSRQGSETAVVAAQSAVLQARTNLDLGELTFKRLQQLYEKRSISDQEFDEGKAKLKAAQAALDGAIARQSEAQSRVSEADAEVKSAQISRGYTSIQAPFAGIVVAKSVDPGVLAAPGMTLLTIEKDGGYRLEASVEESRLPLIHIGDRVPVQIDALNRSVPAAVSDIVPMADPATRSYLVKLNVPSMAGLHSGMFGRAQFSAGTRQALLIPSDAIESQGDVDSVLVAENGVARRRLISIGARSGSQQKILSGLRSGDALIFPLPPGVHDGAAVEVER